MFSWADGATAGSVHVYRDSWHLAASKTDVRLKDAKKQEWLEAEMVLHQIS